MKYYLAIVLLLISPAFITGCNGQPLMDYGRLVEGLRKEGASVEEEGISELHFQFPATGHLIFSVDPIKLKVNTENVTVLEFPDQAEAEIESKRVSSDGYNFAIPYTTEKREGESGHIHWEAPPHWYQKGKIIVFYTGNNQVIISLLKDLLDTQFAGVGLTRNGDIAPEHIH